ncbi:leukocyte cell-derived chemotaxin-2 [Podargus strigoides]
MQRATAVVLVIVISSAAAAQWAKICSSQPANRIRGCDSQGCGRYTDPRSWAGFCIKIFYIEPIKYSGPIKKGEKIGILLPMQRVYRGITSHVHIQNCDLTDPTPNL